MKTRDVKALMEYRDYSSQEMCRLNNEIERLKGKLHVLRDRLIALEARHPEA